MKLSSWTPKLGENRKINDYLNLLDYLPNEELTHPYLQDQLLSIVRKPTSIPIPIPFSVPAISEGQLTLLSDKLYIQITNDKFKRLINIDVSYIENVTEGEFSDFVDSESQSYSIRYHPFSIFSPFLLKNDSLLIYSSYERDSSNPEDSETLISLSLFEYGNYEEGQMIHIKIGRENLESIINDPFSESHNLMLFDYKQEDNQEILDTSIAKHMFKQIIPDQLSKNRFFFVAFKKLYLAEIVGEGNERTLEIYHFKYDLPVLLCDISEKTIVCCCQDQNGKFVIRYSKRTENAFTNQIKKNSQKWSKSIPQSIFLFQECIYVNIQDDSPFIWNVSKNMAEEVDQGIDFFIQISKDIIIAKYNDNRLCVITHSDKVECQTKYGEDLHFLGNLSLFLIIDENSSEIIETEKISSKIASYVQKFFTLDECRKSIDTALERQKNHLNCLLEKFINGSDDTISAINDICSQLGDC